MINIYWILDHLEDRNDFTHSVCGLLTGLQPTAQRIAREAGSDGSEPTVWLLSHHEYLKV